MKNIGYNLADGSAYTNELTYTAGTGRVDLTGAADGTNSFAATLNSTTGNYEAKFAVEVLNGYSLKVESAGDTDGNNSAFLGCSAALSAYGNNAAPNAGYSVWVVTVIVTNERVASNKLNFTTPVIISAEIAE